MTLIIAMPLHAICVSGADNVS